MDKPTKPTNLMPRSFGGTKNNFSTSLQSSGYEANVPAIYGGDNLNYQLDATGKELDYCEAICDFINNIPIGKTITVDSNNKLVYGSVAPDVDNVTINTNSNDQIQAIGFIDNRTSNALKCWTGTRSQYDAITTKDANTIYNITDDTDVTQTLLNLLYPVGAIYIGTMSTCPLSALGIGTWTLKATDRVLQGAGTAGSAGSTVEAGLPNITGDLSTRSNTSNTGAFSTKTLSSSIDGGNTTAGTTFDASQSNAIYGNSNTVQPPAYLVNIWERMA